MSSGYGGGMGSYGGGYSSRECFSLQRTKEEERGKPEVRSSPTVPPRSDPRLRFKAYSRLGGGYGSSYGGGYGGYSGGYGGGMGMGGMGGMGMGGGGYGGQMGMNGQDVRFELASFPSHLQELI